MELGGQARPVLDNFTDKWDQTKEDNADYEDVITREASRDVWRAIYKRKTVFDLRQIHVAAGPKRRLGQMLWRILSRSRLSWTSSSQPCNQRRHSIYRI